MKFVEFIKSKKRILFLILAGLITVGCTVGITLGAVKCKGKDNEEEPPVTYGENGMYYYADVSSEYWAILEDATCQLWFGDNILNGRYTYDGTTFAMYVVINGAEQQIPASYKDGELTVTYNGGEYRFLEKVVYTVTYNANGGSETAAASVLNGKTLSKPQDPVKAGYTFIGWYTDETYKTPFAFDATPITSNTTLYARYVEANYYGNEFKANLMVDGVKMRAVETKNGVLYDLPTPEKEGETFVGWWVSQYKDGTKLSYRYTGQTLAEDSSLYAVWQSSAPAVSVSEREISWTSTGATSYTVKVTASNGIDIFTNTSSANSVEYNFADKAAGEYTVTVTANGVSSTAYYKNKALARVSQFTVLENSALIFNSVENAESYYITVDCGNDSHAHTNYYLSNSTYFNFVNCAMQEGGIKFTVQASANGYVSSVSDTFVYSRDLAKVEGVRYEETKGQVSWNAVAGAMSYNVVVENNGATYTYNVTTPYASVKEFAGDVTVKVTAVAQGYNSGEESVITYTVNKLATPMNVAVNGMSVTWNAVTGAKSYNVKIGAYTYNTTETTYDVPATLAVKGTVYDVSVQAVAETEAENSLYSTAAVFTYGEFEKNCLAYVNGTISWKSVGGAGYYKVAVNGTSQSEAAGSATSAKVVFTQAGENTVTITAVDAYGRTVDSISTTVNASTVTFDEQGGTAVADQYYAFGDAMTFEEPTRAGYIFAGWYNIPGGPKNNGAKYEDGNVYQSSSETTVYAYWTPQPYEVTLIAEFDLDGNGTIEEGEIQTFTETVYYMEDFKLPVPVFQNTAKTFGGWFAERNKIGTQYTDPNGKSVAPWEDKSAESYTLYAGWIDILSFEAKTDDAGATYYAVSAGEGIDYVTEVTIPAMYEGAPVTAIAPSAFYQSDIITFNIPDTVTDIPIGVGGYSATGSAFQYCYDLTTLNVYCTHDAEYDHETYPATFESEGGILFYNNPNSQTKQIYFVPRALTGSYRIPNGIEEIPQRTFYDSYLTEIIIPASVTYIGANAFYSANLESVVFEAAAEGVEEQPLVIGDTAFRYCSYLTEIALPARLQNLATEDNDYLITIFNDCSKLANIYITGAYAEAYYTAKDGVLCNATGDTMLYCPVGKAGEFTVPVGVETIASYAFKNCTNLTKLIIPAKVTTIEDYAYQVESAKVTYMKLKTIEFLGEDGDDDLTIGKYAFYDSKSLQDLVLAPNVAVIKEYAFGNSPALKKVTVNCTSENMDYARGIFASDAEMEDEDSVGYVNQLVIGANSVYFPVSEVFYKCRLTNITADPSNENYKTVDNVLFNGDQTVLVYYPYGRTETTYSIPENVTEIEAGAFIDKANLVSMTIKNNVVKIGNRAFENCDNLKLLDIKSGRTNELSIGEAAFAGCYFTEITLPDMVTSISDRAFENCEYLESVTISSTVERMGTYDEDGNLVKMNVFAGCGNLEEIVVVGDNTGFASIDGILYGKSAGVITAICFVPRSASGDIVVPNTVTTISKKTFYQNKGITSIAFENNTASKELTIGEYAFAEMEAVESIVLPTGLTEIPAYAFNLSAVKTVVVPYTVESIAQAAFAQAEVSTVTFEKTPTNVEEVALTFADGDSKRAKPGVFPGVFAATKNLKEIELPSRTTNIAAYMFAPVEIGGLRNKVSYPAGLRKVNIPAKVTEIGSYAFNYAPLGGCVAETPCEDLTTCTHLGGITLDEGSVLEKVNTYAFENATNLVEFPFGDAMKEVANYAFRYSGIQRVEIPADMKFGTYVFYSCKSLEEAIINKGVSFGTNAFYDCAALTDVTIAEGVTTFGDHAFQNCTSLVSITLPSTIKKIGISMFSGATSLENVEIKGAITEIGNTAFQNTSLSNGITLPNTVTKIGNNVFAGTKLPSFTFPDSTKLTCGTYAFSGCENLKTVTIPQGLASIDGVFAGCDSLEEIIIDDANGNLKLGENNALVINKTGDTIRRVISGTAANGTVTVPEGIKVIGAYAFSELMWLEKVVIPASVTTIDKYAFYHCDNLKEVVFEKDSKLTTINTNAFSYCALENVEIPDGVTKLSNYTFANCLNLKSVKLPSKLTTLGNNEFDNCEALETIVWPDNLTTVGRYAFRHCKSLTSVTIPKSLTAIGSYMFQYCDELETINLHEGVVSLGSHCFANNPKLTKITGISDNMTSVGDCSLENTAITEFYFSKNLTSIGQYAFADIPTLEMDVVLPLTVTMLDDGAFAQSGITSIEMKGVTRIDKGNSVGFDGAFQGCKNLKKVVFGDTLTTLEGSTFIDCTSLESVNLPATLTYIPDNMFYNTGLKTIEIPGAVETIGNYAFYGTKLTGVTIPENVNLIGDGAFAMCPNIEMFEVSSSNVHFYSGNYGALYDSRDVLISFPAGVRGDANGYVTVEECTDVMPYAFSLSSVKSVALPLSMDAIPEGLFAGSTLEVIVLPLGVEAIGAAAFEGCKNLSTVEITGKLETIDTYAFSGCESLKEINLPDSVETISSYAFMESGLESFIAPQKLTKIFPYLFNNAKSLKTVVLNEGIEIISEFSFAYTAIEEITIPESVVSMRSALITGIPRGPFLGCANLKKVIDNSQVSSYEFGMFKDCTSLTEIVIGENVDEISDWAFMGCTSLTAITLSSKITEIGDEAFRGSGITSIEIPESVTTIGAYAFAESKLTSIVIPETVKVIGKKPVQSSSSSSSGGIGTTIVVIIDSAGSNATGSYVFADCKELTTVVFEGVPEEIYKATFKGCTALTSVTFADGWTTIPDNTFEGCTALTNLVIPNTVTTIGEDAFKDWTAEQKILCKYTEAEATALFGEDWYGDATVIYG